MPRRALWARWLNELRSLTPAARVVVGAVVAMVVIGAAWLATREGSEQRVRLIETERVSSEQLSAIRTAFESAGLRDYSEKSGHLEVPREQFARYLAALAQGPDLPYRFFEEVLQRRDWFSSRGDLDRQWDLATQQFLAQIIREMDGVEKAWVRWASASKRGLGAGEDVRASVSVKMVSGHVLSARIEEAIKDLMVGSRAGLSRENVSVVDLGEKTPSGAAAGQGDAEPLERVRQLETHYTEKLERLLAFIEGVIVSVDVTLASHGDPAERADDEDVSPDAVAVDTVDTKGHGPRGQGGALPRPPPIVASQRAVMLDESNFLPQLRTSKAGASNSGQWDLVPARIAVTVGLPDGYLFQPARDQATTGHPSTDLQDQNERIRRLVVAALPTLDEPVTVSVHRFRKRERAVESGVASWIDVGGTTGIQLAAAIALLSSAVVILAVRSAMLTRRLRRMTPSATPAGPEEVSAPHRRPLRGEVESMVHRDTARAAQVLKHWIHEGKQT